LGGEAHHTEVVGEIAIVHLLGGVIRDASEKRCHRVRIGRFPKSIEESKAVRTIILYNTLLGL
jgi:hypothetical protein